MLQIVLFEPEIPPNTGNIIRLCANIGAQLHLIKPLGFSLDDQKLRRAGLDYHEFSSIEIYDDWQHFRSIHTVTDASSNKPTPQIFACTTKAKSLYTQATYQPHDLLLFGPESRGLPTNIIDSVPPENRLRVPMQNHSRSLNLANTVAIIAYEALRQQNFAGLR